MTRITRRFMFVVAIALVVPAALHAQKRGLTLIINKSLVVMSAQEWDITAEVQKGLDAKLPKVSI